MSILLAYLYYLFAHQNEMRLIQVETALSSTDLADRKHLTLFQYSYYLVSLLFVLCNWLTIIHKRTEKFRPKQKKKSVLRFNH